MRSVNNKKTRQYKSKNIIEVQRLLNEHTEKECIAISKLLVDTINNLTCVIDNKVFDTLIEELDDLIQDIANYICTVEITVPLAVSIGFDMNNTLTETYPYVTDQTPGSSGGYRTSSQKAFNTEFKHAIEHPTTLEAASDFTHKLKLYWDSVETASRTHNVEFDELKKEILKNV